MLNNQLFFGYGTTLKKDLTGSVSSIKAEDAYVAPVADLSQALQGRAAGVFVTSIDGAPGTGTTIRIRGGNSITEGNEPLYVIDGFIGGENLSTINPNDIESIEILKDASSTAIYGARGANGVVLITTKKGRPYKKRLNIKTSMGTQVLPKKLNLQNAREYAGYRNKFVPGLFDLNNLPGADTDWQEVLTRSALVSDNLVSLSSGNENTQFYLSTGFLNQEGILLGTAFERYSLRLNLDHKISKTFKVGTNLFLTHSLTDNSVISSRNDIAREDPLKPVFDEEGNFQVFNVGIDNGGGNPFADTRLITNETIRDRVLINNYIEADIIEGLKLRTTLGGDFSFDKTNIFIPSTVPDQIIASRLGSAQIGNARTVSLLNENTLNYLKTFGDHSLSALVGATAQTSQTELSTINAAEIPNDGVEFNAVELAPLEETTIDSGYSEFSLFSLLGRINYSYKDKYYLTFSARRDGSSRLGINNKYATFPSVAVAWRLSDEQFMSGVDFVNDQTVIGSANPDVFGGIQNTFAYKHIDLSFFLQGVFGNENYYLDLFQVTGTQLNSFADLRDRIWTPENPDNALIPGFNSASFNRSNSFFVRDAGFIRLRTLQLGYTLPESVLKGVSDLRISFTGTNLLLLKGKDYIGYDPEVSSFGTDDVLRGYDNVNYPQNRSFVFGLDITF